MDIVINFVMLAFAAALAVFSSYENNQASHQKMQYYHEVSEKMYQIQKSDIAYLNCLTQSSAANEKCAKPENQFTLKNDGKRLTITSQISVNHAPELVAAIKANHSGAYWFAGQNLALPAVNSSSEVGENKPLGEYYLMNDSTYIFNFSVKTDKKIALQA